MLKTTNAIMCKATATMALVLALTAAVWAGPPLPLHQTEGNGGIFLTTTAYLVNAPEEGQFLGLPSVSGTFATLGDKRYQSYAVTENILGDIELGFAVERLSLGDWSESVQDTTGLDPDNHVCKYNFNVRYNFLKEGAFDQEWMPALTLGTHFKWNGNLDDIDRQLMGTCDAIGADHDFGTEFTLVATKMFPELFFGRPLILSAGVRNGDAVHTGFLGFAGERATTFEGSLVVFLTDKLLFATEYRQKSDHVEKCEAGGETLVGKEDDWYDFCLAYLVNDQLTISGGYAHFGRVLEESANCVIALQVKYEF